MVSDTVSLLFMLAQGTRFDLQVSDLSVVVKWKPVSSV